MPTALVYTGAGWSPVAGVRVWDGEAWVLATPSVWDGEAWVGVDAEAPPETYGCVKPAEELLTEVEDFRIEGGTHDQTYSYKRFTGQGTSSSGGATVAIVSSAAYPGDIYNITFDHCVFSTPEGNGNCLHAWALNVGDVIYNITFDHCWFEPAPRMALESNGRGGWLHDWTVNHCMFEHGGGQMLSFDMSPGNYDPVAPWGPEIGGVVRGWEGLEITNNDFQGTGVIVNGYSPSYVMGLEFGCVFPFASDLDVGRSVFSGNRIGRCQSAWMQCNRSGAAYMTFADNLWDQAYNAGGIASDGPQYGVIAGTFYDHCVWSDNVYNLGAVTLRPQELYVQSSVTGADNELLREHWTKAGGTMANPVHGTFEDSYYEDCEYHIPRSFAFNTGCTYNSGCVFDSGHTGGTEV
jgi:hypothetical protein